MSFALASKTSSFSQLGLGLGMVVALNLVSCLEPREHAPPEEVSECSVCHGGELPEPFSAAPPLNLSGEQSGSSRGNGAHATHLLGTDSSRPVACVECHLVPEELHDPGHVDSAYPAELIFSGPATAFKAIPQFDPETGKCANTFCHGGSFVGGRPSGGTLTEPEWVDQSGEARSCEGCHGQPPPAPHPAEEICSDCHKNIDEEGSFSRADLHVDGLVTFFLPSSD